MVPVTNTTSVLKTDERLHGGQRTVLAVQIARQHHLTMDMAIAIADTVADLLPTLPADMTRRCACGCGQPIGPNDHWASRACFIADEGHPREDDR